MLDLYLFNTIINTIWYIFTILFVLYKFTSFFSYIYNFTKFCGKIFIWTKYLYDQLILYLQKKKGYKYSLLHDHDLESQTTNPNQTYFQKIKTNIWKTYIKYKLYLGFSHRQPTTNHDIPLNTTSVQSNIKNESYNCSEQDYFNNHINDLNNSSIIFDYTNDKSEQDSTISFNLENSKNSSNDNFNFNDTFQSNNNDTFQSNNNDTFQSINLSNYNSNILSSSKKQYNIESQTFMLDTFSEQNINRPYNVDDSNLLFNSNFIFNSITKQSKRENNNDTYLFEFENKKDKKIKLDNLNNSISFSTDKNVNEDLHDFNKEITKNPYI